MVCKFTNKLLKSDKEQADNGNLIKIFKIICLRCQGKAKKR